MNVAPKKVLTICGLYLIEHKEKIKNGNIKYFLEKDFSEEISNAGVSDKDQNLGKIIIESLKIGFPKLTAEKQEKIVEACRHILKSYLLLSKYHITKFI